MDVLRYTAFSSNAAGGNRAGVVLDAPDLSDAEMLAIASDIGYSETAFIRATDTQRVFDVRYFSPLTEVPFCGHTTIAAAAAYAERNGAGELTFRTQPGPIAIRTGVGTSYASATLTSVTPSVTDLAADDLDRLRAALRWSAADLDPSLPPKVAYAGAHHPVIAAATRERLAALEYNFEALRDLMVAREWTTVDLVWREAATSFHARNPFPTGGVVEDAATGAAAAALGGYLRAMGLLDPPVDITVEQGVDLGRPSRLDLFIPADPASGIDVSGTAVELPREYW